MANIGQRNPALAGEFPLTSADNHALNVFTADMYTAPAGEEVYEIGMNCALYSDAVVEVGIYDVTSGYPTSALIASGTITGPNGTPSDATNTLVTAAITPVALTEGNLYAVAFRIISGTLGIFSPDWQGTAESLSALTGSSALPANWTNNSTGNFRKTVFATTQVVGGGVALSVVDADARRGQTDFNYTVANSSTWDGITAIPASADIDGSAITITDYPLSGTGVVTATIPATLAELYNATAVLTHLDDDINSDTANVNFLPAATDSSVVTALPLDLTINSFFYNYSGAAPTAGMNITGTTLTSVTGKTVTYNTDGTWGLSAPVTVDETITVFFTSTDGTVSTAMIYTFYVGGGGGFTQTLRRRRKGY